MIHLLIGIGLERALSHLGTNLVKYSLEKRIKYLRNDFKAIPYKVLQLILPYLEGEDITALKCSTKLFYTTSDVWLPIDSQLTPRMLVTWEKIQLLKNPLSINFKIVLCGNPGTGKTALCIQFIQRHFVEEYEVNIEDNYRTQRSVDGSLIYMDILDTCGMDEYQAMRQQYMRWGEGYILVYAVTSRSSFEAVLALADQIRRVKDREKVPIILCGNKSDLEDKREVNENEGRKLARVWGCPFYETSAAVPRNVDEIFMECARQIRKDRYMAQLSKKFGKKGI